MTGPSIPDLPGPRTAVSSTSRATGRVLQTSTPGSPRPARCRKSPTSCPARTRRRHLPTARGSRTSATPVGGTTSTCSISIPKPVGRLRRTSTIDRHRAMPRRQSPNSPRATSGRERCTHGFGALTSRKMHLGVSSGSSHGARTPPSSTSCLRASASASPKAM